MAAKRSGKDYLQAVQTVANHAEALHFPESPAHGKALVNQLAGHVLPLRWCKEDDPVLYAYRCADQLPYIARFTIELQKWVRQVTEATPDEISQTGAQP